MAAPASEARRRARAWDHHFPIVYRPGDKPRPPTQTEPSHHYMTGPGQVPPGPPITGTHTPSLGCHRSISNWGLFGVTREHVLKSIHWENKQRRQANTHNHTTPNLGALRVSHRRTDRRHHYRYVVAPATSFGHQCDSLLIGPLAAAWPSKLGPLARSHRAE